MAAPPPFDPSQLEALFGELFQGKPFGGKGRGRGADLLQRLTLSPREAREGTRKAISVQRHVPCTACEGSGRDAAAPRCGTCGGSGVEQKEQGFVAFATPCSKCKGRGHDERYDCGACDNGLVGRVEELTVVVPPGCEDGCRLRLQGKGDEGGSSSGDLYVAITIDGPNIEASPYRGVTPETLAAERAAEEAREQAEELEERHPPRNVLMTVIGVMLFMITVALLTMR